MSGNQPSSQAAFKSHFESQRGEPTTKEDLERIFLRGDRFVLKAISPLSIEFPKSGIMGTFFGDRIDVIMHQLNSLPWEFVDIKDGYLLFKSERSRDERQPDWDEGSIVARNTPIYKVPLSEIKSIEKVSAVNTPGSRVNFQGGENVYNNPYFQGELAARTKVIIQAIRDIITFRTPKEQQGYGPLSFFKMEETSTGNEKLGVRILAVSRKHDDIYLYQGILDELAKGTINNLFTPEESTGPIDDMLRFLQSATHNVSAAVNILLRDEVIQRRMDADRIKTYLMEAGLYDVNARFT